jgi:hypothetical protein
VAVVLFEMEEAWTPAGLDIKLDGNTAHEAAQLAAQTM